jgi:hypothetical protein
MATDGLLAALCAGGCPRPSSGKGFPFITFLPPWRFRPAGNFRPAPGTPQSSRHQGIIQHNPVDVGVSLIEQSAILDGMPFLRIRFHSSTPGINIMATPAQATALKQLYTGIFGFFPTKKAFDWYTAQIGQLGLDTAGLANVLLFDDTQLGASNTFDYSNGDAFFVRQIYQSLFGWSDEALTLAVHVEGVDYWTKQLNGVFGGDKGKLIETMLWVIEVNGPISSDVSTRQAFRLLKNYVKVSTYALEQVEATGEELPEEILRAAHEAVAEWNTADRAKEIIDTSAKALSGTSGDDTINGTNDNDMLIGGAGANGYYFALGDGEDTV